MFRNKIIGSRIQLKTTSTINKNATEPSTDTNTSNNDTENTTTNNNSTVKVTPSFKSPFKTPAKLYNNNVNTNNTSNEQQNRYFTVMYCDRSLKKHKTYNNGVVACIFPSTIQLYDESYKLLSKSVQKLTRIQFVTGTVIIISKHEIELDVEIDKSEFDSGRIFINKCQVTAETETVDTVQPTKQTAMKPIMPKTVSLRMKTEPTVTNTDPWARFGASALLYDPNEPNALILNSERINLQNPAESKECPVVVYSRLAQQLRTHQCDGVIFMYRCITGYNGAQYLGTILADEMGLGKTLQVLTLLYTLLKSGPQGQPVISRAVVICPTTLVGNWLAETKKWIGYERLNVCQIVTSDDNDTSLSKLAAFIQGRNQKLLLISYENYKKFDYKLSELTNALIICDEGHRLKNSKGNQLIESIKKTKCKHKIILTGTPIQNNLTELYALCEFVNPGYLGDFNTFNRVFVNTIEIARNRGSTKQEQQEGEIKSAELQKLINKFVLRRNQSILTQYLGVKNEQIIFIPLSTQQSKIYKLIITSNKFKKEIRTNKNANFVLTVLQTLQQVTNSLQLLYAKLDTIDWLDTIQLNSVLNDTTDTVDSSKTLFVQQLCQQVKQNNEKIVLCSGYTKTLDLLESMCSENKWSYFRLDGATNNTLRTEMINSFNSVYSPNFIFLLSKQAGGIGVNLIGANRLVLFEPQWNPSIDSQAVARIWRDGQTREVYIYKLIASNTIDEKILQRQLSKNEISLSVIDQKNIQRVFDNTELQQLLTYKDDIVCATYDIIRKSNTKQQYTYYSDINECNDPYIKNIAQPKINFVFARSTTDPDEIVQDTDNVALDDTEATLDHDAVTNTVNNDTNEVVSNQYADDSDHMSDFIVSDSEDPYTARPKKRTKSKRKRTADPKHYVDPRITAVDSDEATLSDIGIEEQPDDDIMTPEKALAESLISDDSADEQLFTVEKIPRKRLTKACDG